VQIVRAAAEGAELKKLELLIDAGADVNAADPNGRTVVQWAVLGGGVATVGRLVELGALVGQDAVDGWSPLMSAAMRGQNAVIDFLLVCVRACARDTMPCM
jgi:ankyrin repeat protein